MSRLHRARHVGKDIIAGLRNIVTTRFTTSVIVGGAAELLAVGTAVVIEPD